MSRRLADIPTNDADFICDTRDQTCYRPFLLHHPRQTGASDEMSAWYLHRSYSVVIFFLKITLIAIGIFQCFIFLYENLKTDAWPWAQNGDSTIGKWMFRLADSQPQPLSCHSHNDYWRSRPLFDALERGCSSVEADVWDFQNELYVAHSFSAIRRNHTLKSMYLDPLQDHLDRHNNKLDFLMPSPETRNGIFSADSARSLILLIDFKNHPEAVWDRLDFQLNSFRQNNYLTYFNGSDIIKGPITIVVSGDAPFRRILANQEHRDIFYDAPLHQMCSLTAPKEPSNESIATDDLLRYNRTLTTIHSHLPNHTLYSPANSYYASTSLVKSVGFPRAFFSFSKSQLNLLRKQVLGAHARGLKVRYWDVPRWPPALRDHLWRVLLKEGVDFLSVDEIDIMATGNWVRHGNEAEKMVDSGIDKTNKKTS